MSDLDDTRHCPMCEDAAKKILELEQRVKVLTDGLQNISSIGKGIGNMIAKDLLNQTPQQSAAQIERGHIEWMMRLPVAGHRNSGDAIGHYGEALYAIPPLPKESNSPETDLDEALRRQ